MNLTEGVFVEKVHHFKNMKSPTVWFLVAALTAGVFIVIAFNAGSGPEKRSSDHSSPPPASASEVASKPDASVPAASPAAVSQAVPENAPREVILEAINDAAITYDPVELPKIKPFLLHPDADVRRAALDGMVVLGDAAAAPLLRDAARQVASSKEAVEMMQAAEYLELPSATGRLKDGPIKVKNGPRIPTKHR